MGEDIPVDILEEEMEQVDSQVDLDIEELKNVWSFRFSVELASIFLIFLGIIFAYIAIRSRSLDDREVVRAIIASTLILSGLILMAYSMLRDKLDTLLEEIQNQEAMK